MIIESLVTLTLFISSLLFHEMGHLIIGTRYSKATYMKWVRKDLVTYLPDNVAYKYQKRFFWAGIIAGFIPLIVLALYAGSLLALILTLPYLYGCWFDFQQIRKISKEEIK